MLLVDLLALAAAYPAIWLALVAAHWNPTLRDVSEYWLIALILYCFARIVQIVVFIQRYKEIEPPMPDGNTEYPEFDEDKGTDRLAILDHTSGPRRNWGLLGNVLMIQVLLSLFRLVPYTPLIVVFGWSGRYLNDNYAHIPTVLFATYMAAGWFAAWIVWSTVFNDTYNRIDQRMEYVFWSIWPW